MQDFNARASDEILYKDSPDVTSEIDLFLQELDVLFSIEQGTVFGNRKMGLSLEQMLWSTSFNADMISVKIQEDVESACLMNQLFQWEVDVQLLRGVVRDIGVITIIIKNSDGSIAASPTFIFK